MSAAALVRGARVCVVQFFLDGCFTCVEPLPKFSDGVGASHGCRRFCLRMGRAVMIVFIDRHEERLGREYRGNIGARRCPACSRFQLRVDDVHVMDWHGERVDAVHGAGAGCRARDHRAARWVSHTISQPPEHVLVMAQDSFDIAMGQGRNPIVSGKDERCQH